MWKSSSRTFQMEGRAGESLHGTFRKKAHDPWHTSSSTNSLYPLSADKPTYYFTERRGVNPGLAHQPINLKFTCAAGTRAPLSCDCGWTTCPETPGRMTVPATLPFPLHYLMLPFSHISPSIKKHASPSPAHTPSNPHLPKWLSKSWLKTWHHFPYASFPLNSL